MGREEDDLIHSIVLCFQIQADFFFFVINVNYFFSEMGFNVFGFDFMSFLQVYLLFHFHHFFYVYFARRMR